jgi:polysaccharide export outer membrane protein
MAHTSGDDATVSLYATTVWTNVFFEADYIGSNESVGAGGVVVRASRDFRGWLTGSGYLFALGSDGVSWQYAIFRQVNGTMSSLQNWTPSKAIHTATNRLSVLTQNDHLQFYINGQLIWEHTDNALSSGHVGLIGSTGEGQEALHTFRRVAAHEQLAQTTAQPSAPMVETNLAPVQDAGVVSVTPVEPAPKEEDKSPLLRPGLLVRVTVLVSGKRDVDAEIARISDNNQLDLPLIGPVSVNGMTLQDLNAKLQARYQDFFINPQVLAEFVFEERPDAISPWGSVVVLGRVRTPGRVNIPPTQDLTVSAAIQQAGGLDSSAKESAIRVTRRKADGKTERFTVDLSTIGKRGHAENDLSLKPGDLIFIPERVF